MDAPHEVLTNLLRFRLGRGYSSNAFFEFLTAKERASFSKRGISSGRKIEIIQELSTAADLPDIGTIFGDFYNNQLRNAVGHSDYILVDDDFRSRRSISRTKAFRIPYDQLDEIICAARAFIAAFFKVELLARQVWGLSTGVQKFNDVFSRAYAATAVRDSRASTRLRRRLRSRRVNFHWNGVAASW